MYSPETIERIIEEITHQVLVRLSQENGAVPPTGCNCGDGSCVQNCAEKVGQVVLAGATRLSASLGTHPQDKGVAKMIDHTLLKPDASQEPAARMMGLDGCAYS